MNIRVLLLDLDGTTLENDKIHISAGNQEAIRRAGEMGIMVIPCTGRVLDMFPPDLTNTVNYEYGLSSHGARVTSMKDGVTIFENIINPEDSAVILKIIEGKGIYCEIAADNTIYMEESVSAHWQEYPVPSHHIWYLEAGIQKAVKKPSEYFLENRMGIEKINIYGMPEHLQEEIFEAVTATGVIKHTRGGAGPDLEFQSKDLDKVRALDVLLEKLNLSYDNVMIIGDSSSDIDVIRKAAVGVAMGNSPDWIKEEADYVTGTNDQDGVANAIEHFILFKRQ
jgi:hypothetical protein